MTMGAIVAAGLGLVFCLSFSHAWNPGTAWILTGAYSSQVLKMCGTVKCECFCLFVSHKCRFHFLAQMLDPSRFLDSERGEKWLFAFPAKKDKRCLL